MKAALSRKIDKYYLLVASTERELIPLRERLGGNPRVSFLCCGVGPVEAAYSLSRFLAEQSVNPPSGVINFGIAGAYPGTGVDLLDLGLATGEVMADLGVCDSEAVHFLTDSALNIKQEFELDSQPLFKRAADSLAEENIPFHKGVFVTLNCASATRERGEFFRNRHQGLCENMEGAALARVCAGFAVDFLELRTISNMVEDRDSGGKWLIDEACDLGARWFGKLIMNLLQEKDP
ncbi:MAG: futalosine hydrolase [Desulfurivibrionaceae bacterium]